MTQTWQQSESGSGRKDALRSAFEEGSGGQYSPETSHPAWKKLKERLAESGHTPDEFVYFLVFYVPGGSGRMKHRNFVTGDKLWQSFLAFRKRHPDRVALLVKLQREEFKNYRRTFDDPCRLLLQHEMAPPVKVDTALRLACETGEEFREIYEKYWDEAMLMVRGAPEYLEHCLYLKRYLETGQVA